MMKKELYIGTVTFVLVIALIYMPTGYAQNLTKNASNAAGNASAGVNQTGSQLQKNASEVGKNASEVGGQIVNKTEDVGKKIAGGLGSLLGNASEKLKEGSK
jgi:predicted PurR-regulated permease PerM